MTKKRLIYSIIFILTFILSVALALETPLQASASSYNYNDYLNTIEAPEAMIVKQVIKSGEILDDKNNPVEFGLLKDIFVLQSPNLGTRIYLLDQTKNRIIVLNEKFEYIRKYPELDEGIPAPPGVALNAPSGIHVTEKYVYVADTENQRVGVFTHNWGVKTSITKPDDPTFESVAFKPLKVSVDATNGFTWLLQHFRRYSRYQPDYTFNRYVGSRSPNLLSGKDLERYSLPERRKPKPD